MKRIPLFRQALAALGACAFALVSAGVFAQGATIQLSDPNCSDFTLGGTAGNRTLIVRTRQPTGAELHDQRARSRNHQQRDPADSELQPACD